MGRGGGPDAPGAGGAAGNHTLPSVRPLAPSGTQALERIDDKRQRLEIELDALDRLGRRRLVNRGDGQNRLALIERLVRQRALGAAQVGKVVGRQDRLDAGQRERSARVDAADARVRHRAEEQLREQHALDAIVLRVLRAAGHLGDEVGRRVVLADELLVRHGILGSARIIVGSAL